MRHSRPVPRIGCATPDRARLAVALGSIWLAAGIAGAQEAPPAADGEATLRAVAESYRGLPAYADRGALTMTYTEPEGERALRLPVPLAFRRPDLLLWDAGVAAVVGQGDRVTTVNPMLSMHVFETTYDRFQGRSWAEVRPGTSVARATPEPPDPADVALLNLADATLLGVLTALVTEPDAAATLQGTATRVVAEEGRLPDGDVVRILRLERANGSAIRLWIDPATDLLRRMELVLPEGEGPPPPDGLADPAVTLAWESGPIETDPDAVSGRIDKAAAGLLGRSVEFPPDWLPPPPVPLVPKTLPPVPPKILPMPVAPSKALPMPVAPPKVMPMPQAPAAQAPAPDYYAAYRNPDRRSMLGALFDWLRRRLSPY